ncbi:MAG: hypothetical protein Q9167_001888 [Letrouitia subvulpina]
MSVQPPRVIARPPGRSNGVLAIPASATQKRQEMISETQAPRFPAPRLKIVIRHLPPGLTQPEFEDALGEEWRVHSGKVDWAVYKPGKISKDDTLTSLSLSKPSRPSRAYLRLTNQEYIKQVAEKIRSISFDDSRGLSRDPSFQWPVTVEFAPYGKVPSSRGRKDARQGTIDQDPEFIDFLESLTNPITKSTMTDSDIAEKTKEKITTTPLIQYLKDKKANETKKNAATTSKGTKHIRQESKDNKPSPSSDKKVSGKASTAAAAAPSVDKRNAQVIKENATREVVRVLNKQATPTSKPPKSSAASSSNTTSSQPVSVSPLAEKKRERGNASAAANILRRDLGIGSGPGGRGGRRGAPAAQVRSTGPSTVPDAAPENRTEQRPSSARSNETTSAKDSETSAASTLALAGRPTNITTAQPPTGPAATRVHSQTSSAASTANLAHSAVSPSSAAAPKSTATQAFLKHANPSQGVTEPLLEEAFVTFGTLKKVEIDKKKGFAYIDFEEPEGLQNAIRASPIKVAQGQVVVMERKTGSSLQTRNLRGGPMMNNRGGDMRGGPIMKPRGGADMRAGPLMNNRGGMPMGPRGGRGGSMRGRGSYSRGGGNTSAPINARPAAAAGTPSSQNVDTKESQAPEVPAASSTSIPSNEPSTE